jgi:dephospho-CoA kinase
MPKNVAVLGMPGSGKSEAIQYLQDKYTWPKVYFGDVTFNEMKRRGLERTQANERLARENLRNLHGEDYYAQEVIKMIDALGPVPIVLVESFYSAAEYRVFRERFGDDFITIAIHARPSIRHKRLSNRPDRPLTRQEAEERDWAQLTRLTQGTPIALADFMIVNEGEISELHAALDRAVGRIGQS